MFTILKIITFFYYVLKYTLNSPFIGGLTTCLSRVQGAIFENQEIGQWKAIIHSISITVYYFSWLFLVSLEHIQFVRITFFLYETQLPQK